MLTEKITEEELDFMESWHIPRCLIESMFNDFDNFSEFDENKFGNLRIYQFPMVSYEPIIDEKLEGLSEKEQFRLRKNAGDVYNLGARKYGKTCITEKVDILLSMLNDDGFWCGCSSIDTIHLRGVLDDIKPAVENHPILKDWKSIIRTSPHYKIKLKNGWHLDGINMNLQSKNPGHQFYGKHVKKLYIEEGSFETEAVYNKRKDALSELGAIIRISGMTNFTKYSPVGKIFFDPKNKSKVINLPQYVNPHWDDVERQERKKEFGGEDSAGFRVFVKGEVIEDGISEFDMERVKECYIEKKEIKSFEIKKDRFPRFRDFIIVERPKNADRIFICVDVGETAGSEIIVLSEVGEKYNYLYNITLYNLIKDEQLEILTWLIEKLEANIIGLDCGDAMGRVLADDLEKKYSKENVVRYAGATKLPVGFEKDNNNRIVLKNGNPVHKQEFMSEWAVQRLKVLLYETRVSVPIDYKFDMQFNSVISTTSGTRKVYACVSESGDHLFDAFKVFAISQWLKKDFNQTPKMQSDFGIGASSWSK